jgi:predicted ATPase
MHKKANQMSENILQKNNLLSIESALELHLQYLRFFELITYLHSSKNNLKNFVFDESLYKQDIQKIAAAFKTIAQTDDLLQRLISRKSGMVK